ncbi:hypothetical protein AAZX31_18G079400 [Glycine max]
MIILLEENGLNPMFILCISSEDEEHKKYDDIRSGLGRVMYLSTSRMGPSHSH